jgi:hypothetical protein
MKRMEEKSELASAYVTARIKQVNMRRMHDEMNVAEKRGDLIAKDLVAKQAAFLLIALRQQILNLPQTYARRILGLTEVKKASKILREMSIAVLSAIKNLPDKSPMSIGSKSWKRRSLAVSGEETFVRNSGHVGLSRLHN